VAQTYEPGNETSSPVTDKILKDVHRWCLYGRFLPWREENLILLRWVRTLCLYLNKNHKFTTLQHTIERPVLLYIPDEWAVFLICIPDEWEVFLICIPDEWTEFLICIPDEWTVFLLCIPDD